MSIPHPNMMEWYVAVSGYTAGGAPKVWAETILALVSSGEYLAT
jgi:hypothetical protein